MWLVSANPLCHCARPAGAKLSAVGSAPPGLWACRQPGQCLSGSKRPSSVKIHPTMHSIYCLLYPVKSPQYENNFSAVLLFFSLSPGMFWHEADSMVLRNRYSTIFFYWDISPSLLFFKRKVFGLESLWGHSQICLDRWIWKIQTTQIISSLWLLGVCITLLFPRTSLSLWTSHTASLMAAFASGPQVVVL